MFNRNRRRPRASLRRAARSLTRRGVTLLEMLIVLSVLAILAAAAAPTIIASLSQQRALEATREVTLVLKQLRYRARNLNRAVGINVSADSNSVLFAISGDNTCAGLNAAAWVTAIDVSAQFDGISIQDTSDFPNSKACIRPNGQVLELESSQPFADGGSITYVIARDDLPGKTHLIVLPFNGIARMVR